MKKKGFLLILVMGIIYWGYYFVGNPFSGNKIKKMENNPIAESRELIHNTNINLLQTSIEIFHQSEGRYPKDLEELIVKGILLELPYSGGIEWEYNPENGTVR